MEAKRLEALWSGEFGDAYVQRNRAAGEGREEFWGQIARDFAFEGVLEIGCNVGANLRWIAGKARLCVGVDVNARALRALRDAAPGAFGIHAAAQNLPFMDGSFGLVFTAGVLIHQPTDVLRVVMTEMVRCSRSYVLMAEYFSPEEEEVPYRGQERALFKRNYGSLLQGYFPDLRLLRHGSLNRSQGWDDVTYWVFQKPA